MSGSYLGTIRSHPRQPLTIQGILVIVIVLVGSGVRLHHLDGDSLWYDEILSVEVARSGLVSALSVRDHPPLFYFFVSAVMNVWGETEFVVRLPSAIAGILALPMMIVLGRTLGRPVAGFWAGMFLALSPFHLRYSQETRHYAWLMTFALASSIFLYLATTRTQLRWWVAFAVASTLNLYTHYGSLVVLVTHSVLIAIWLVYRQRKRWRWAMSRIGIAATLIVVAIAPRVQALQFALEWNVGNTAGRGNEDIVPVANWLKETFYAFGGQSGTLPFLMAGLFAVGLLAWIRTRNWWSLAFFVVGVFLPLLVISVVRVARWSFPKYVIYLLPLYLMTVGVGLDYLLKQIDLPLVGNSHVMRASAAALAAGAFLFASLPRLQEEYDFVERDWRGVADHLRLAASEEDVVVTTTLDLPSCFNQGRLALLYYLEQNDLDSEPLVSCALPIEGLQSLSDTKVDVWATLLDRVAQLEFDGSVVEMEKTFPGSLYLVHVSGSGSSTLDKLISLYEQAVPLAVAPSPQCLLKRDLSYLHVASEDFITAERLFEEAQAQCPSRVSGTYRDFDLVGAIYHGLLDEYVTVGANERAYQVADRLLEIDPKDAAALQLLTEVDLLRLFQVGQVEVHDDDAPESIRVMRFVMPQNGDWEDVLLIHPPASVSFRVNLPAEATAISFRTAMAPESWNWGGDGSTFVLELQRRGAQPVELFRNYVSNQPTDRGWHDALIPLEAYAGQTITLTMTTEAGPNSDTTGDWAGWGAPRIIRYRPSS